LNSCHKNTPFYSRIFGLFHAFHILVFCNIELWTEWKIGNQKIHLYLSKSFKLRVYFKIIRDFRQLIEINFNCLGILSFVIQFYLIVYSEYSYFFYSFSYSFSLFYPKIILTKCSFTYSYHLLMNFVEPDS
jgi:hypothetical protein